MENMNTKGSVDRQKYIDELKSELENILSGDIGFKEITRIDEINDILDELEPLPEKFSKERAWKEYKHKRENCKTTDYNIKKKLRVNKKFIKRMAVACLLMVIFLNLASSTLIGANIFDLVVYWDSDILRMKSKNINQEDIDMGLENFESIDELEETLDYKIMAPHYLPNEYQLSVVTRNKQSGKIFILYSSKKGEKVVNFSISDLSHRNSEMLLEKDDENVKVKKMVKLITIYLAILTIK
jgi:hypothetical protein